MYFVIQQAWSQRLIIPMNDATSAAVRHLFGDKAQMVEEYYVEKKGSAFEQLPNKVIIEIWTKERVDEYIDRGLEHPRKPR